MATTAASIRRHPAPGRVEQTAHGLIELLGGAANIDDLTYCFTKLRLRLTDHTPVDHKALLAHPAVMGLIEDTTFQIMLGPAAVERVAHAMHHLLNATQE